MKPNQGFTTLTITFMLVSILVAVAVFTGKVLVSDKRIALNEIEYRVAFAAAEKGLAEAIAELKVNPLVTAVSGSVNASAASATYNVAITDAGVTGGGVKQVVSTATLDNGAATTISVQVAERGILSPNNSGPAAPLMVNGELDLKGTFDIIANPNGGGPGVAVSLWAKDKLNLGGSAKTCGQEDSGGGCGDDLYSESGDVGLDVVENDSTKFPTDMVEYIFGVPDTPEGWQTIESMAVAIISSCSDSKIKSGGGLYIVSGDCEIKNDKESIGSASQPVVLIVKDGDIKFNGGDFYGLLFSYDSDPSDGSTPEISLKGNGTLNGSLLINYQPDKNMSGTFLLNFDPDIFCTITVCDPSSSGGSSGGYLRYGYIPGSWKDW